MEVDEGSCNTTKKKIIVVPILILLHCGESFLSSSSVPLVWVRNLIISEESDHYWLPCSLKGENVENVSSQQEIILHYIFKEYIYFNILCKIKQYLT